MTVPFAFANLSGNIALAKLDSNFNTPITIGNTSVLLGNTVTTLNNLTLANVTITSGTSNVTNVNVTNITVTNLTATLANVTTLNASSASITSANIGTLALTNPLSVPNGGTGQVTFPANSVLVGNGTGGIATVAPGNVGNVLTSIGGAWVSNVAMSGAAAGANTQVQYNNSGALAGSANLVFDGTNLGLGVTPSAWKSNYKATQVGNATAVVGRTDINNNYFSSNWYVNSSNQDIYQNTGYATLYSQGTGTHAWYTAPSGTAGNAITFTQAMTLDASGNLCIGTTTPGSSRLQVTKTSGTNTTIIGWSDNANSTGRLSVIPSGVGIGSDGLMAFSTNQLGTDTFNERMRLDSSGNLGIGTTSPADVQLATAVAVNSASGYCGFRVLTNGTAVGRVVGNSGTEFRVEAISTNPLTFYGNNTERARIDSSGNLGIGTASPNASAILDAQSTTKGVRMPNMTTTQKNAIASPAAGLMVFDTTLAKLCVYSGSAWQTITSV